MKRCVQPPIINVDLGKLSEAKQPLAVSGNNTPPKHFKKLQLPANGLILFNYNMIIY